MSDYLAELAASVLILAFIVFAPVLAVLVAAGGTLVMALVILALWLFKCGQAFINVLCALVGRPLL